ncbi:hypothetical protein CC2G_003074 [Coprinopsis cinerea AmutBmut pab1-1]|nr:hypothetical protein CC2G_003074 [Coprinopsis cinerea AmutBmut pab1-1]
MAAPPLPNTIQGFKDAIIEVSDSVAELRAHCKLREAELAQVPKNLRGTKTFQLNRAKNKLATTEAHLLALEGGLNALMQELYPPPPLPPPSSPPPRYSLRTLSPPRSPPPRDPTPNPPPPRSPPPRDPTPNPPPPRSPPPRDPTPNPPPPRSPPPRDPTPNPPPPRSPPPRDPSPNPPPPRSPPPRGPSPNPPPPRSPSPRDQSLSPHPPRSPPPCDQCLSPSQSLRDFELKPSEDDIWEFNTSLYSRIGPLVDEDAEVDQDFQTEEEMVELLDNIRLAIDGQGEVRDASQDELLLKIIDDNENKCNFRGWELYTRARDIVEEYDDNGSLSLYHDRNDLLRRLAKVMLYKRRASTAKGKGKGKGKARAREEKDNDEEEEEEEEEEVVVVVPKKRKKKSVKTKEEEEDEDEMLDRRFENGGNALANALTRGQHIPHSQRWDARRWAEFWPRYGTSSMIIAMETFIQMGGRTRCHFHTLSDRSSKKNDSDMPDRVTGVHYGPVEQPVADEELIERIPDTISGSKSHVYPKWNAVQRPEKGPTHVNGISVEELLEFFPLSDDGRHYLHCGCDLKEALTDFFLWKKYPYVRSRQSNKEELFGMPVNPRIRTWMYRILKDLRFHVHDAYEYDTDGKRRTKVDIVTARIKALWATIENDVEVGESLKLRGKKVVVDEEMDQPPASKRHV